MSSAVAPPAEASTEQGDELRGLWQRYSRVRFASDVRQLSRIRPWLSVFWIAAQWAIIVLAFWAAIYTGHWAVYILAAVIIGTRLQALGVLMHDGAHYLLFRNRTLNDMVSDIFCAFPTGMSTTLFRHTHFQHHRNTNSEHDPDLNLIKLDGDFAWPRTRWGSFWLATRCLLSLNVVRTAKVVGQWSPGLHLFDKLSPAFPLRSRLLFVTYAIGTTIFVIEADLIVPTLLLMVLPGVTYLNFSNRLRATAEHLRLPGTHELNSTRTMLTGWWGRFFLCPNGIGYHIEHHLFPSVPGYHLPQLHRLLMSDDQYVSQAHITRGYVALARELMEPLGTVPAFPPAPQGAAASTVATVAAESHVEASANET